MTSMLKRLFGGTDKEETRASSVVNLPPDADTTPTPCQLECQSQQKELVACVAHLRETGDSKCLSAAVDSWTTCCAEANIRGAQAGE